MSEFNQQNKAIILVVDDTPDNLSLISGLLKDQYKVKVANSGKRGLEIARSDVPPDLILLDVMMPEMDGYEVCRQLKLDPLTRDIPLIFLTAKASIEDEQHGLELGAVDYITKPVSPPILLARVKTHLTLKAAIDLLREKNYFLNKEVQKLDKEIVGMKTGVFVYEIDAEELNTAVSRLAKSLAENDPKSDAYLEKYDQLLQEAFQSDFTRLQKVLHDYDYAGALAILKKAAAQWQITC